MRAFCLVSRGSARAVAGADAACVKALMEAIAKVRATAEVMSFDRVCSLRCVVRWVRRSVRCGFMFPAVFNGRRRCRDDLAGVKKA